MKKLELNQMENLEGGNDAAKLCGIGVGIATFGYAVFGPFAVLGLALCLNGDS